MVLQRDFLMRQIAQLAEAFINIVAGKGQEAPEEARTEIDDLVADVLGTSPHFVLGQGAAAMEMLDPALAAEVSRLLLLHAELSDELQDDSKAEKARKMAFEGLRVALDRPTAGFATLAAEQLRDHYRALEPVVERAALIETFMAAFRTAAHHHDWDDAEDWLFFALQAEPTEARLHEGLEFYQRLEALSDKELSEGGLSRAEVRESAAELERFAKPG